MRATKLFKIFDISIQLHFSWYFVFLLLTWSLATAYFPLKLPDYSTTMYWIMGGLAALFLFLSVLLQELSHSLVAKARNIKVESITLFFFGGVAGITKEDMKPSSEFLMAIAGPLFSLFLSGLFFLIYKFNGNAITSAITFYLFQLNLILAIFNMVPGFPLDGGRAFRAILYAWLKDLKKATRIAAGAGKIFASFLIFLGIFGLISGVGGNGIWLILLGGFLFLIANASNEQVILRETLSKIPITKLMQTRKPLDSELTFSKFLKKYKNSEHDIFLVTGKRFSGILDMKRINNLPKKLQDITRLRQLSLPLSQIKALDKKDTAYDAFKKFSEQGLNILPLLDKKKIIGVVYRNSIINRLMAELKFTENHSSKVLRKMHRRHR